MKLKIKVKEITEGCMPVLSQNGDWIDLRSSVDMEISAPQSGVLKKSTINGEEGSYRDVTMNTYYIPLGIAIKLPKGFEAIIDSRSSGPKKMGIFIPNGQGVVDNSYSGNKDEWNYICSTMRQVSIKKGDRICQFRIQLSQKATVWQKIKWLLSSGVELIKVDDLGDDNRGGLGSTGIK